VALVIGNSHYGYFNPLPNPVRDARAVADALCDLSFSVLYGSDFTKKDFSDAFRTFTENVTGSQVRFFYYAGHGLQVDGENYLVPVDARFRRAREAASKAVDLADVFRTINRRELDSAHSDESPLNIILLDACRNNPLPRNLIAAHPGFEKGLAVPRGAPAGTIIGFATAPGRTASDGDGDHSPYTTALLNYISKPGLPLRDLFDQVRESVMRNTLDQQTPWENVATLPGVQFSFRAPVKVGSVQVKIDYAAGGNRTPTLRFPETKIGDLSRSFSAQHGVVSIAVENASSDTLQDATNLLIAFGRAHWATQGVGVRIHGTDIGVDGLPVPVAKGILIYSRSDRKPLAEFVRLAIKQATGVETHQEPDETINSSDLWIVVGVPE